MSESSCNTSAPTSGEPIDAERLSLLIGAVSAGQADSPHVTVDVLPVVDSTNAWLIDQTGSGAWHRAVCVAREQRSGRGRRGRSWECRADDDIPLSVGWRFTSGGVDCSGLSLAVGVGLAGALRDLGAQSVGVKWPNDLVASQRKLAGILIQTVIEKARVVGVVVGVGLNMSPLRHAERVGLAELAPDPLNRTEVAAKLVQALFGTLADWETYGMQSVHRTYGSFDVLNAKEVTVTRAKDVVAGVARGIDVDGALLIETDASVTVAVHEGDASLGGYGVST